jgi:hypothetical protein
VDGARKNAAPFYRAREKQKPPTEAGGYLANFGRCDRDLLLSMGPLDVHPLPLSSSVTAFTSTAARRYRLSHPPAGRGAVLARWQRQGWPRRPQRMSRVVIPGRTSRESLRRFTRPTRGSISASSEGGGRAKRPVALGLSDCSLAACASATKQMQQSAPARLSRVQLATCRY